MLSQTTEPVETVRWGAEPAADYGTTMRATPPENIEA
jgi:hypothetical protein